MVFRTLFKYKTHKTDYKLNIQHKQKYNIFKMSKLTANNTTL